MEASNFTFLRIDNGSSSTTFLEVVVIPRPISVSKGDSVWVYSGSVVVVLVATEPGCSFHWGGVSSTCPLETTRVITTPPPLSIPPHITFHVLIVILPIDFPEDVLLPID